MTYRLEKSISAGVLAVATSLVAILGSCTTAKPPPVIKRVDATSVRFDGVEYLHRFSASGLNEYTPKGQEDLERWRDMVTIIIHDWVSDDVGLADLANRVLGNFQRKGEVVRTNSIPRSPEHPAEHFIAALMGRADFLEAIFARFVLVDGVGVVVLYAHRHYGADDASVIGTWVRYNGPATEAALMAWTGIPALSEIRRLPQGE